MVRECVLSIVHTIEACRWDDPDVPCGKDNLLIRDELPTALQHRFRVIPPTSYLHELNSWHLSCCLGDFFTL